MRALIFLSGLLVGLMLDQTQSTAIQQKASERALVLIADFLTNRPECKASIQNNLQ
jgi:hypothetical protein